MDNPQPSWGRGEKTPVKVDCSSVVTAASQGFTYARSMFACTAVQAEWYVHTRQNVKGRKKTATSCRMPLTILAIRKVGLPRGSFAQVLSGSGGWGEAQRCTSWSGGWRRNLRSILVCLGGTKTVACWRGKRQGEFWMSTRLEFVLQSCLPDYYASESKTNKDPSVSCRYWIWTF